MHAVLLDFNGTMFFDSSLHLEAWSKIYRDLYPDDTNPLDIGKICGPGNNAILKNIAPWLTDEETLRYSEYKEELYRQACKANPNIVHLVPGVEEFLVYLQEHNIPFALASASIKANIDFFFETFGLDRWFRKEDVVYDDGTYPDKGAMHLEAARRLNTDIGACLLVEDSPTSVALAKRNGAGCVVAVGETASGQDLIRLGADHFMKDFTEFDYNWLDF